MTSKRLINVLLVNSQWAVRQMFDSEDRYHVLSDVSKTKPDLICFTGGADVDPQLYGEKALTATHIDVNRDKQDIEAWKEYFDIPKVGICRGGQFLNIMSGGAMFQHVDNHRGGHNMINLLRIPEMPGNLWVTSTHHQMMIPGEFGEVIGIAMKGPKGLADVYLSDKARDEPKFDTEIVWYPNTKSLCYQPHPEHNMTENRRYFFRLLNHFFFGDYSGK